jgi:hypothetical protein
MITIRDYMESINYRITEGSDYCWQSFGPDAYRLESWSGEQDGTSVGIVFDTRTQVVYQMEAHDYSAEHSYRWTHPDYQTAFREESQQKLSKESLDVAWDNVKFTDLEVAEDMIIKASAIVRGQPYDTRVQVPVELNDSELFQLMKIAHERDITLNQLVEQILTEVIKKEQVSQSI